MWIPDNHFYPNPESTLAIPTSEEETYLCFGESINPFAFILFNCSQVFTPSVPEALDQTRQKSGLSVKQNIEHRCIFKSARPPG